MLLPQIVYPKYLYLVFVTQIYIDYGYNIIQILYMPPAGRYNKDKGRDSLLYPPS